MRKSMARHATEQRRKNGCIAVPRGQAALEYLITYGWGFLVILVMLGALAYFGYLTPSRYVPARCSFGMQLECVDYRLSESSRPCKDFPSDSNCKKGNITLQLLNNFGADINITEIGTVTNMSYKTFPMNIYIAKGEKNTTYLPLNQAEQTQLVAGDRMTVPLIITFRRNAVGSPLHNITGEVFATVQRGP